jgi:hypothetical protein
MALYLEALVRGLQVIGALTALTILLLFGRAIVDALSARPRNQAWRLALSIVLAWLGAGVVFGRASFAYLLAGHIGVYPTELVWRLVFLVAFLTSGALAVAERWHGDFGVWAFLAWSGSMALLLAAFVALDLGYRS